MLVVCVFGLVAASAAAEPMFLAKNETRCTSCHYSPTGGGLLTPYGRLQSRQELSTTSGDSEAFLWGAFGDALGPVDLGHRRAPHALRVAFPGGTSSRFLMMNADLLGAVQAGGWTFYGQVGRRPEIGNTGGDIYSYEYWGGKQLSTAWAIRAGRFLPAYGIRFADHTSYNRTTLGFDKYDQVLGAEVSHTTEKRVIQISAGPGRAEAVFNEEGKNPFTTTGRVQFDLNSRNVVVGSGLFRSESGEGARRDVEQRGGRSGVRVLACIAHHDLDGSGRAFQRRRQRAVVRVRERNVGRGDARRVAEIFAAASHGVGNDSGLRQAEARSQHSAAHALERRRRVLSRSNRRSKLVTHTVMSQLHLYL